MLRQAAYLIAPPGKEKAHDAKEAALPKHKIPDPENAPVPASPEPEAEAAPAEPEAEAKSEVGVHAFISVSISNMSL